MQTDPAMATTSSLNVDALVLIFDEAVRSARSWERSNSRYAPLNISRTCRRWREILLSNARFWANFECETMSAYELAPLWLKGSRNAVINVCDVPKLGAVRKGLSHGAQQSGAVEKVTGVHA